MFLDVEIHQTLRTLFTRFFPQHELWIFGSRVSGQGLKPFSDIDLVIVSSLACDLTLLTHFSDAVSESDIPYKVDILQWFEISESLRDSIQACHEIMYKPHQ